MSAGVRTTRAGALAAALLALGACGGEPRPQDAAPAPTASPPEPRARGAILLVVDTLRSDRLGAYGYERPTSPNLDAFAARSTLWTRNHAQGPWTLPSMVSLMTGLSVVSETKALPRSQPTVAELLSEAGVETAAFVGNPVAGPGRGFDRGFDHFEVDREGRTRGTEWVERFASWHAGRADAERPWFAWIHMMDPHHPYNPRVEHDRWGLESDAPWARRLEPRWFAAIDEVDALNADLEVALDADQARTQMVRASNRYDGEVLAVDDAFGRLLEHLRASGELDRTLIAVAADHGEMFYEYVHYPQELGITLQREGGLPNHIADYFVLGHRAWFYPENWNTPLIVGGPGFEGGGRRAELSANLDLAPTLLEAFGVDAPDHYEGLSKYAADEAFAAREAVFGFGFGTWSMLRSDGVQLVEHLPVRFGLSMQERRPLEVFDHRLDEPFLRDLSADRSYRPERLREELRRWRRAAVLEVVNEVDADSEQVLRDLGYVEDGD